LLNNIFIDLYTVHACDDETFRPVRYFLHPWMIPNLFNSVSLLRIGAENIGEKISCGPGHPVRQLIRPT